MVCESPNDLRTKLQVASKNSALLTEMLVRLQLSSLQSTMRTELMISLLRMKRTGCGRMRKLVIVMMKNGSTLLLLIRIEKLR